MSLCPMSGAGTRMVALNLNQRSESKKEKEVGHYTRQSLTGNRSNLSSKIRETR